MEVNDEIAPSRKKENKKNKNLGKASKITLLDLMWEFPKA